MFVKQKELLEKLDKGFIREVMKFAIRESHDKGVYIFHQGDAAAHLYVLIKGSVKLVFEETDHAVYNANHPGEIFGWSSILGREMYSTAAECLDSTIVRKIDKNALSALLTEDKGNGLIFYKKISEMLGNRLLHSYTLTSQYEFPKTMGSGQLQEIIEAA
jgi:CRP-like cAMP-binding protein